MDEISKLESPRERLFYQSVSFHTCARLVIDYRKRRLGSSARSITPTFLISVAFSEFGKCHASRRAARLKSAALREETPGVPQVVQPAEASSSDRLASTKRLINRAVRRLDNLRHVFRGGKHDQRTDE